MTISQRRQLRVNSIRLHRGQGNPLGFQKLKWQLPSDLTKLDKSYLASAQRYHYFYRCMKSYNMDRDGVWISEFGDDENTEWKIKSFFANMSREEIVTWSAENNVFWRDSSPNNKSAQAYISNLDGIATYLEYMIKPTYRSDNTYESDYMYGVICAEIALGTFNFLDWDYFRPDERQYVITRSCLIAHYNKFVPNKYSNDISGDVSILKSHRPIRVSRIDIIPNKDWDWNRVVCEPTDEEDTPYISIHSAYVLISEPHSVREYTLGFSFGPNGFIPIGISGQGVHTSSDLFKIWAQESQQTQPVIDTSRLDNNVNESINNVAYQGNIVNGSVPSTISGFYKMNINVNLPTSGEYVNVDSIPGRGDFVISNFGNVYEVLDIQGNPYSPNGFIIEVVEGKLH